MALKNIFCLIVILSTLKFVVAAESNDSISNSTSSKEDSKIDKFKVTLDQKISVQNAKLQAITNLRKQLVQSREVQNDNETTVKKEMEFMGQLRRVGINYPESSPNLIDLVVEKKVLTQNKSNLIYSQPITLSKIHYILNVWKGKTPFLEVISADNS